MAPIDLTGIWKNVKNENLDNFLKALNLNFAVRKIAAPLTLVLGVNQDGDVFRVVTKGLKKLDTSFTVGQEYTDMNPLNDKEPSTYLASWDGDKLRVDNKSHPEAISFVRELVDGRLVQTQSVGYGDKAVVCKRIFEK